SSYRAPDCPLCRSYWHLRISKRKSLNVQGRIDSQRAKRTDQQQRRRDEQRQLVAAGPLDEYAEDNGRNHTGDAEAGVHHAARGAREWSGDIERQRPQHRIGQLEKEKRGREQTDGADGAAVTIAGTMKANAPPRPATNS